jgi:hypothetical protein
MKLNASPIATAAPQRWGAASPNATAHQPVTTRHGGNAYAVPLFDILAGAIITEHTVTMAFMFLFARVVVLTLILYVIGQIWFAMTGREPAFAHH